MPYSIRREGNRWAVVNKGTGEVRGHTSSHMEAQRMIEAIYAHTGEGGGDAGGGKSLDLDETMVYPGSAIKAIGDGKVAGHLVLFGSPDATDLEGDYFTAETDFGLDIAGKSRILYQHSLDPTIGGRKLGLGSIKMDEAGVWIEGQLELRDDYERKIYAAVESGKMGWSSGTARHLIRKEKQPNGSHKILSWPLGLDASITPTPAEYRTQAVALKSLAGDPVGLKLLSESADDRGGALAPAGGGPYPAKHPIRSGMAVKWDRRGDMAEGRGMVKSVHTVGKVPGVSNEMDASEAEPAARVKVYKDMGHSRYVESDHHLAHKVKHLTPLGTMKGEGDEEEGGKSLKGQYLGDTDETMTCAAVERLHQMMCWKLYSLITSDVLDESQLLDQCAVLVDEYRECVLATIAALMPGDDHAGAKAEAVAAAKSLHDQYRDRLHAGLPLRDHLDSVHAAVKGLGDRLAKYRDMRAAEGRPISPGRKAQLKSLVDALNALHDGVERASSSTDTPPSHVGGQAADTPPLSEVELLQLQAESIAHDAAAARLRAGI